MPSSTEELTVAVIGGGLVGLHMVIGLLQRGVKVQVYEQARSFREIGAGIGFAPNAIRVMEMTDPRIPGIYYEHATESGEPGDPSNWYGIYDGINPPDGDEQSRSLDLLFKIEHPPGKMAGVWRPAFLEALVKLLPPDTCHFRKRLENVEDRGDDQMLLLTFKGGSTAEADVVIGCDGIKSSVKKLILGADNPASKAHFTHTCLYRGLAPMEKALEVADPFIVRNKAQISGKGAHFVVYPVNKQTMLNMAAFAPEPNEWPHADKTDEMTTKTEAAKYFAGFTSTVRNLFDLMQPELNRWALFDTYDHPAPTYVKGRVAIVGDAAHAMTPHHGAGASIGIEGALSLAVLMKAAADTIKTDKVPRASVVRAALAAYDAAHRERSQWVVGSSRWAGRLLSWENVDAGSPWKQMADEMLERTYKIWNYDHEQMVEKAKADFEQRLGQATTVAS